MEGTDITKTGGRRGERVESGLGLILKSGPRSHRGHCASAQSGQH